MNALYTSILCVLAVETTGRLRAQETTALATTASMGCLPIYQETSDLVAVGPDVAGRQQWLQPAAARAWRGMQRAEEVDGVSLLLVSAFRSVDQQRQIFERKLRAGQTLEAIQAVNVPPGFSQHHTGTAST